MKTFKQRLKVLREMILYSLKNNFIFKESEHIKSSMQNKISFDGISETYIDDNGFTSSLDQEWN